MLKKTLIGFAGALALTGSLQAQAVISTIDVASLAKIVEGNLTAAKQHFEKLNMDKNGMQHEGDLAAQEIDAMNNGFANMIARMSKSDADLFNMEVMRESAPGVSACVAATGQALSKEGLCAATQQEQAGTKRHEARHATAGLSQADQTEIQKITQEEHFDACNALSDGDRRADVCASAGAIIGTTTGATMSPEEAEASERFIDYIVGISPLIKQTFADPENLSPSEKRAYNKEQEAEAYRSLIASSMEAVKNERTSPDPAKATPSRLQLMETFSNDRYGNEEWMRQVFNVSLDPDEKNKMMPDQVERESLALQAFQADMQVRQYEQSLRMEALMAALLSKMAD